jgi:hypothetical protein
MAGLGGTGTRHLQAKSGGTRISCIPSFLALTGCTSSRLRAMKPRASGAPRQEKRSQILRPNAHESSFVDLANSGPDGSRMVTASSNKKWTRGSGTPRRPRRSSVLRGHRDGIWHAGFSPDWLTSSDGTAGLGTLRPQAKSWSYARTIKLSILPHLASMDRALLPRLWTKPGASVTRVSQPWRRNSLCSSFVCRSCAYSSAQPR